MTDYQIDTDALLAKHRKLALGLKTITSAEKMTARSFELYGPTNIADWAKWLCRSKHLPGRSQLGQVVQAHQHLLNNYGVYGWLQILLTSAVYQYQRDLNTAGRGADTTYLSRQHVDDMCRLGTHVVLNYAAPTVANRQVLAHFMSGNYARLIERVLPAIGQQLAQDLSAESLEQATEPVFRLPQQALNLSIVHELDLRPMDVDEPVNDDGFAYWPSSVKQEAIATLTEAEQHMVGELTMLTRALQDDSVPTPWDDAALVRARLEATMGVAWASQCLSPHPEVASDEHRALYLEDLVSRVEQIQERGMLGTISADMFQTRQLVEDAATEEPATLMLYERAQRQSVDNAAWVLLNWVPDIQTAGFLAQLLLDYQFDTFFDELEKL